jgi:hypothetical protein
MSNPVRQHYIPKSYLRNFGQKKGDTYFVDAMIKKDRPKILNLSTTNICLEKNLYTFPVNTAGDRFELEKFYAVQVDGIYPTVYGMLVNANITVIGEEDKRKILNTILSLYFRTPHFLNNRLKGLDQVLDKMIAAYPEPEHEGAIRTKGGQEFKFKMKDVESMREQISRQYKEDFLIQHFADWQAFVKYKLTCGITVMHVPEDIPLITSDNPILIMEADSQLTDDVFSPSNIIEVPLDRNHYLVIMPNSVGPDERMQIRRDNRDKHFAAGTNLRTDQNGQVMMVCYPGDMQIHLDCQAELGAPTPENFKNVENSANQAKLAIELLAVIEKNGTHICQEVADKVKAIRKTGLMKENTMLEGLIQDLARHGYLTA